MQELDLINFKLSPQLEQILLIFCDYLHVYLKESTVRTFIFAKEKNVMQHYFCLVYTFQCHCIPAAERGKRKDMWKTNVFQYYKPILQ